MEATELGHHEPSGKIRLGLRASFFGDTAVGARGHGGPIGSPKLAGVHGYRWTVRLGISVDVGFSDEALLILNPGPPTCMSGHAGRDQAFDPATAVRSFRFGLPDSME